MPINPLTGFILVSVGGASSGSFLAPMTKMKRWAWENSWIVYATFAFLIFPWIFVFLLVPNVSQIYAAAGLDTVLLVFLFGLGWGVGSLTFGLGIYYVGMSLGYAIILGLISSIGSLVPLAVLHPDMLTSPESISLYIGVVVIFIGLAICAKAGMLKENSGAGKRSVQSSTHSRFLLGLGICLISGLMSPCMNFGFAFGEQITAKAIAFGTSNAAASFPLSAIILTGGFLLNVTYCIYLLRKKKTWNNFTKVGSGYWIGAILMALLWYNGIALYGFGILLLGDLGPSIGWPVLMIISLVVGNFWGFLSGEWKGAEKRAIYLQLIGIFVLSAAIIIIGFGNI